MLSSGAGTKCALMEYHGYRHRAKNQPVVFRAKTTCFLLLQHARMLGSPLQELMLPMPGFVACVQRSPTPAATAGPKD